MADTNETAASRIDLTTSDFRMSGCAWCHPGGGALEYDREGFRFDGAAGLFATGANPAPKNADYQIFGIQAGADASSYAGAGFFEASSTTGVFAPNELVNQGTLKSIYDPAAAAWKTVGKKYNTPAAGGAAEVDCLMCHYAGRYANLERNYAFPGATAPKLAASLGLVGAGAESGLLRITTKGSAGVNPNPASTTWSWNEFVGVTGTAGNPVLLHSTDIVSAPRPENCALCHFPDRSLMTAGPSSKPLGFTAFQKYMAAGTTKDGDEIAGVNGGDGNNDAAWNAVKGRVEGGKRGESINDNLNPDAHMKWPAYAGSGPRMACAECHYNVSGTFTALVDASLNEIQPGMTVNRIDHQLAKGDNAPDGKNMDQLDNTVTCQGCHVDRTHPGAPGAPDAYAAHAGFPAAHFDKISCKTCHIPWLNGPVDQDLADFSVGPYQTFERTQTLEAGATGINRRPLYLWRQTEHGAGHMEIQPFGIMSVLVWANATSAASGEAGAIAPTYQRLGKKAAEQLRAFYGDANLDGVYDWPLNRVQNGDKALIVNTQQEIADFIAQIGTISGAPANPVMHFYFNQFTVSHNIRPLSATTNATLGSRAGGGCVMCHASSDPGSPSYRAESIGFFDGSYPLFTQPTDGGAGLVQTSLPAGGTLTGDLERVNIKFPYKMPDGSSASVNLSGSPGETVGSSLGRGAVLGYDGATLAQLMDPATGSFAILATATTGGTISDAGETLVAGFTDKSYTITPAAGYRIYCVLVDGHDRGALTAYTFANVAAEHRIAAYFTPDTFTIGSTAGANGTIAPAGTVTLSRGASQTYAITAAAGYHVADVLVDGASVGAVTAYTFTDVGASHTISATFAANPSFTITASAGANGSISPAGDVAVLEGTSKAFTITPASGYRVADVLVDGVSVGAVTSYTFSNVSASHTISASFVQQTFTILASSTSGGSISPAGTVTVVKGQSQTFTITPSAGYRIYMVLVNGRSKGAVGTYTFANVQSNQRIAAYFTKQ